MIEVWSDIVKKYVLWIFLLTVWQSILFYGHNFGLSVILFLGPLSLYLYYLYKENIQNKKGLILLVPINLLALTYLIYDNAFFDIFNVLVISALIILMHIICLKPTFEIRAMFDNAIKLITKPFRYFKEVLVQVFASFKFKINISKKIQNILKGFLLTIPFVLIIIFLLASADMVFEDVLDKLFLHFHFKIRLGDSFFRILSATIFFFYLGGTTIYLLNDYQALKDKDHQNKTNLYFFKILFITLNIIYLVFDFIQIKSLLLHMVSENINYAQYARQGFFQLLFVSIINISLILWAKRSKEAKEDKFVTSLTFLMVIFTFVIILSSYFRMNLYEMAFGYTLLRLLVYVTLITETILLIPTILYIFNFKINLIKTYLVIIISVYTLINFANVDAIIARRNIQKYYKDNDIDLAYLENGYSNNIKVLIRFYDKLTDAKLKEELYNYFSSCNFKEKSIWEFNFTKNRVDKLLKEIKKA